MSRPVAALDAWAVISLLRGEPAARPVRAAIEDGAVACWVNLGEALYIEARRRGFERAAHAITGIASLVRAEVADAALTESAAELKAAGGLSYADCFAVATAARCRVPLLTGDPEILDERRGIEVVDLR